MYFMSRLNIIIYMVLLYVYFLYICDTYTLFSYIMTIVCKDQFAEDFLGSLSSATPNRTAQGHPIRRDFQEIGCLHLVAKDPYG